MNNQKKIFIISLTVITSSCSYITGPEGYFPPTKYDFIEEKIEKTIKLVDDDSPLMIDDHYPVLNNQDTLKDIHLLHSMLLKICCQNSGSAL